MVSVLVSLVGVLCGQSSAVEKPNILLIVSDDQGYADTGFTGCHDIPTPHLDALAKSGVRCTNGYVSHPFCSPTRAGLPVDKTYDSVNLVSHLTGEKKSAPHECLFWRVGTGQSHAMREGEWKIVCAKDQPAELFNLTTDLAAGRPEIASRLVAALDAWDRELAPPAFPGSSVKNEDWGPGGANQKNAATNQPPPAANP